MGKEEVRDIGSEGNRKRGTEEVREREREGHRKWGTEEVRDRGSGKRVREG